MAAVAKVVVDVDEEPVTSAAALAFFASGVVTSAAIRTGRAKLDRTGALDASVAAARVGTAEASPADRIELRRSVGGEVDGRGCSETGAA